MEGERGEERSSGTTDGRASSCLLFCLYCESPLIDIVQELLERLEHELERCAAEDMEHSEKVMILLSIAKGRGEA